MRGVLIRARREDRIEDHMKTGVNVWGEVATKRGMSGATKTWKRSGMLSPRASGGSLAMPTPFWTSNPGNYARISLL